MEDTKNAREIMEEEADAAVEEPQHNDGMTQEERQARYDEAVAQMHRREADERELQRLEERRQYRQFVAGQLYPTLWADAPDGSRAKDIADNAVALAGELIAALDRAEALDGASDTEQ